MLTKLTSAEYQLGLGHCAETFHTRPCSSTTLTSGHHWSCPVPAEEFESWGFVLSRQKAGTRCVLPSFDIPGLQIMTQTTWVSSSDTERTTVYDVLSLLKQCWWQGTCATDPLMELRVRMKFTDTTKDAIGVGMATQRHAMKADKSEERRRPPECSETGTPQDDAILWGYF